MRNLVPRVSHPREDPGNEVGVYDSRKRLKLYLPRFISSVEWRFFIKWEEKLARKSGRFENLGVDFSYLFPKGERRA